MRTRRLQSSSDLVTSIPDEVLGAVHQPVLLHEALEMLAIRKDDVVVDATLGGAGHAGALAEKLEKGGVFIGFDLDRDAIERARSALKDVKATVHLIESNFRFMNRELDAIAVPHVDKILFDLGWSAFQLEAGRGFSFLHNEPLLMTYTKEPSAHAVTAATIVNEWKEESIADVIYGWGEERYSRKIAKAIVEQRVRKPFTTSEELAACIKAVVPSAYRYGRIHPATRTFQALRIAVNDEMGALKDALTAAWYRLSKGGRIAVITFHSIEDRYVKQTFVQWEKEGNARRITKKPLSASEEELKNNPRSRSAKLRVIEKI